MASLFTFWSFVSLFNPLDGILPNDISFFDKLLIGFLVLLTVFILSVFVAGCYVISSHQVCLGESSTKNSVYVKYGDMYSPDIVEKGYNLVPSRYIEFVNRDETQDYDSAMKALQSELTDLLKQEEESKKELLGVFKDLGYEIKL